MSLYLELCDPDKYYHILSRFRPEYTLAHLDKIASEGILNGTYFTKGHFTASFDGIVALEVEDKQGRFQYLQRTNSGDVYESRIVIPFEEVVVIHLPGEITTDDVLRYYGERGLEIITGL